MLAEVLSESDYTTRMYTANPNLVPRFDFDRGFDDDIFNWEGFASEKNGGIGRYLEGFVSDIRSNVDTIASLKHGVKLKLRDIGFGPIQDDGANEIRNYVRQTTFDGNGEFLFLNLMEAHSPYRPPREYRTVDVEPPDALRATLGESTVATDEVRQAYEDSVRYLSDVYEDIFGVLREDFDYIVTLSDHSEILGERGRWGHLCGLDLELTHIPLVVSGIESDDVDESMVNVFDVHRTILDLAGVDSPSRGQHLLDSPEDRTTLTEYHGLMDGHRESLETDGYDISELTENRSGVAVPPNYYGYETADGWREWGEVNEEQTAVRDRLLDDRNVRNVESDSDVSEAVQAQLEDLGYA